MQVKQGCYEDLSRATYNELVIADKSIYPLLGLSSEVGELAQSRLQAGTGSSGGQCHMAGGDGILQMVD